jgi:hypothetical protein
VVASTYRSKKAKGKRAERYIANLYKSIGLFSDAKPQLLSGGGYLKGDIWTKEANEFCEEVKNQEKVKFWDWIAQAEAQASGLEKPVLHITRNNSPVYSVLRFEDFAQLRLELKELRELCQKKK